MDRQWRSPHPTASHGIAVKWMQSLPLVMPVSRDRTPSIQVGPHCPRFDLTQTYLSHGLAEGGSDHTLAVKAKSQRLLQGDVLFYSFVQGHRSPPKSNSATSRNP